MKITPNYSIINSHNTRIFSNLSFKSNTFNQEKKFSARIDSYPQKYPVIIGKWEGDYSKDRYLNVNIYDDPYQFKKTEILDGKKLKDMIENIKKTYTGVFVKRIKHEELIPDMLKKQPDIIYDDLVVKYGNTPTEMNLETQLILEKLYKFLYKPIELKDLKTISYIVKTEQGYDNVELRKAYSVYDVPTDTQYLYIPEDGILKRKYDSGYVANYNIY